MSQVLINAKNLSKYFPKYGKIRSRAWVTFKQAFSFKTPAEQEQNCIFHDLSFQVYQGQKIALIGQNSCGKSTLLRVLAGIYKPTSGSLEVALTPSVIFSFSIIMTRYLSVLENAYLCAGIFGITKKELDQSIDELLDMTDLTGMKGMPLFALSDGQKQRLAIALFALAKSSRLIFIDESFDSIDMCFQENIMRRFPILTSPDTTFILTSHNPEILRRYCTSAIWLEDKKIKMVGDLDTVLKNYGQSFRHQ